MSAILILRITVHCALELSKSKQPVLSFALLKKWSPWIWYGNWLGIYESEIWLNWREIKNLMNLSGCDCSQSYLDVSKICISYDTKDSISINKQTLERSKTTQLQIKQIRQQNATSWRVWLARVVKGSQLE
jgi:hypothetical protein